MALASAFLSSWQGDPASVDQPALEATLRSLLDRSRAAHPGLEVPADSFAAFIGEKTRTDVEPVGELTALAVEDLYLACGCTRGDGIAVRRLRSAYDARIVGAFRRLRLSDGDVPDLTQGLYERVLVASAPGPAPGFAQYEGPAPPP